MAETVCEACASGKGVPWYLGCTVQLTGRKVFLLIGHDTIFIWKESNFANNAGYYIY